MEVFVSRLQTHFAHKLARALLYMKAHEGLENLSCVLNTAPHPQRRGNAAKDRPMCDHFSLPRDGRQSDRTKALDHYAFGTCEQGFDNHNERRNIPSKCLRHPDAVSQTQHAPSRRTRHRKPSGYLTKSHSPTHLMTSSRDSGAAPPSGQQPRAPPRTPTQHSTHRGGTPRPSTPARSRHASPPG